MTIATATPPRTIPPTRYQGSKRKLCGWLYDHLGELEFDTVLDAFGGSGAVSYMLKSCGKQVTYNDILRGNQQVGRALIENDTVQMSQAQIERILSDRIDGVYPTFIRDTFAGIYFTDAENDWLDRTRARIARMRNPYARAVAWYALIQSAIAKRPFNLFHRRNLYMRTARVRRSFGNKKTWDRPFADHFRAFARSANSALIDGFGSCRVTRTDAAAVDGEFDLVYIDPPYINQRGVGVDYHHFYHFIEGMLDYDCWSDRIDRSSRHLRLRGEPSPWLQPDEVGGEMNRLFSRFRPSIIAVSYRGDGIPSIEAITKMLKRIKRRVTVHRRDGYQYALSTNRASSEILIIAQ